MQKRREKYRKRGSQQKNVYMVDKLAGPRQGEGYILSSTLMLM